MMIKEERKELYKKAIYNWGEEAQIDVLVEECGELIAAIKQWQRGKVEPQDVASEIADVQIMCEQITDIIGEELVDKEKDFKLNRLKTKLYNYQK